MNNGILITIEGGEGAGKTTQIAFLKDKLTAKGYQVVVLREPGGTEISEQIREVVLSAKNTGMQPTTEVLLFQAARAQIYGELVIPALKEGKIVLMDRSRDSSVVYQGMVRGFGKDMIENLNNISTQNVYPNLTILLDVEEKEGMQRRVDTGEVNRLDAEQTDFHQAVRDAYLQLANENQNGRWRVVDANQAVEAVKDDIWQIISAELSNLM